MFSPLNAFASYSRSSGSYSMGLRAFRSIFLLLSSLFMIMSFFYDFSRNRFPTAFFDKSFTTRVKLAASNLDSSPNKFYKRVLFYKLLPPTFFRAFSAAYLLALSGHYFRISLSFEGSKVSPLLDSSCFTNYSLNLLFPSSRSFAISGARMPSSASTSFLIISDD